MVYAVWHVITLTILLCYGVYYKQDIEQQIVSEIEREKWMIYKIARKFNFLIQHAIFISTNSTNIKTT